MDRPPAYYPRQTSSLATVSLIAGLLGWVLLPLLGSLTAIITGHLAKREIRASGGALEGDGLATAGLVLGYIQFIPAVLCLCTLLILTLAGVAVPFLDQIRYY